jgi:hypothetical protein
LVSVPELRGGAVAGDVGVPAEEFLNHLTQNAHAVGGDDPDVAGGDHHGVVQELIHVGAAADEVGLLVDGANSGAGLKGKFLGRFNRVIGGHLGYSPRNERAAGV